MKRAFCLAVLCLALSVLAGCGGFGARHIRLTAEAAWSVPGGEAEPAPPAYDIYEPFGLTHDKETDTLYFNGRRVRCFWDGVEIGDGTGWITHTEHIDEAGTVDVHTLRETVENGDGSVNPFGPLTGLAACSQAEFDARDMDAMLRGAPEAVAACGESGGEPGVDFADRFAPYRDYGVEFVESPGRGGVGNVYLHGALAEVFCDVSGDGTFVFHSADGGDFGICTVYDVRGNLCGVERFTGEIRLG